MDFITELREKRAKAWEDTKAFLDSKRGEDGMLAAEDAATYEKMEADVVNLGREIERLERQQTLDEALSKPVNTPITHKPSPSGDIKTGTASDEYKQAFWNTMKRKNYYDAQNSLQIGVQSGGGYLVPDEFEAMIIDALQDENIIRKLANVITSASGDKKIPVAAAHGTASWVDELATIPDSDDSFGVVTLNAHKLATLLKISEELLNDSAFNMESYIAKEFARRIGRAEEEAFLTGDGSSKPTGLITSGNIGVTAASATAITADDIIDLYHALREPYRKNAAFITNDSTIKAIRKLKDSTGNYLWQPSIQNGLPDSILGRPIKTSVFVPTIAAGAKIMAFGDYKYYWVADRQGRSFQRLNELYAVQGQVGFKASERVDGKLTLAEAVQVLQMKAA